MNNEIAITPAQITLVKETWAKVIPSICDLGRRHLNYGAEETHYAQVGAALLWTLETGLGEDWSEAAETAWTNAYQLLAGVMLEGAREGMKNTA